MTEAEWLVSTNPESMLWHLRGTASNKKLRLFALAWAHEHYHQMEDDRSILATEVAERFVESAASHAELIAAFHGAKEVCEQIWRRTSGGRATNRRSKRGGQQSIRVACSARDAADPSWDVRQALRSVRVGAATEMGVKRSSLLRDIFGNPFRPVIADLAWLTSTIIVLAQAIYSERAFDRLPILADALEEAGCQGAEILAHCRGSGSHVKGCFVIDLILGKE
jgi:hypothetical protein